MQLSLELFFMNTPPQAANGTAVRRLEIQAILVREISFQSGSLLHGVKGSKDPSTDPANPIWLPDLFLGMKHLLQISA